MTQEYVEMLREALTKCQEAFNKLQCPGCNMNAMRQKCAFEQGGDCPRHEVAEPFRDASYAVNVALATPIPPAPLRPMSEAPVNAQLLKALEDALLTPEHYRRYSHLLLQETYKDPSMADYPDWLRFTRATAAQRVAACVKVLREVDAGLGST